MTHHNVLVLLGIAGVAATFTGFTGVVAAFGHRAEGGWRPEEQFRLVNMLCMSLGACLLSFVPLAVDALGLSAARLWTVAGTAMALFCVAYVVYAEPRRRRLARSRPAALHPWVAAIFWACLILAVALQALNAAHVLEYGAGAFITGLVLLLVPAAIQFAYLVLAPVSADGAHPTRGSSGSGLPDEAIAAAPGQPQARRDA